MRNLLPVAFDRTSMAVEVVQIIAAGSKNLLNRSLLAKLPRLLHR
jgi:hypothetical protein